ncbi:MAG: GNAT family N-acetyltransferase [Bacteroidetes bacterium]|nr:MAG: GNAT family N-acetyltransferase [Bacteroidota bacterium]PTM09968.1 MAG: GNAT family N-acetyltransferase [Bacteroidota bacterium]
MSKINIRSGNKADLPAVHQLVRELAIYEKEEASFTATLADYERDYEAQVFECLVAETEDKIVGMALYYLTYSTWKGRMLYLEDFVINEAWRKEGIGQRLFDALLVRAGELECRLVKWQVLDWNEPAIRFYEKNEAIIEKDWWNGKLFL